MIQIRKSHDRGLTKNDWLQSFHGFSFGDYYDPVYMGFGSLRVINEDFVAAGKGFATHPHRNMEIITYIIDGELQHHDSTGRGSIIRSGEIQKMSAGGGIQHSEFNPSQAAETHLLQIWIKPDQLELTPAYEQKKIDKKFNQLILVGSALPSSDTVTIHQDVNLFVAYLLENAELNYQFAAGRKGWLQLIKGNIIVNGSGMQAGDGAAIENESSVKIICQEAAEVLLFDMA